MEPSPEAERETDLFSDEELAMLALAADPDAPVDPDARPLVLGDGQSGLLPSWYMPAAVRWSGHRTRAAVVIGLVATFLAIEAAGLCSTYGPILGH